RRLGEFFCSKGEIIHLNPESLRFVETLLMHFRWLCQSVTYIKSSKVYAIFKLMFGRLKRGPARRTEGLYLNLRQKNALFRWPDQDGLKAE
ncbi:MAG: hypothetical protein ACI33O_11115, partial [Bhargavaea sp.]